MKLEKFRISNYRSIKDSGWIDVGQRTVFVGRNESGKSNLLLALRSGYQSEEGELNGALIGFGLNWKGFSFDIARELGVNPLSDRTFYSLSAHF